MSKLEETRRANQRLGLESILGNIDGPPTSMRKWLWSVLEKAHPWRGDSPHRAFTAGLFDEILKLNPRWAGVFEAETRHHEGEAQHERNRTE